jgi:penicillin amidase
MRVDIGKRLIFTALGMLVPAALLVLLYLAYAWAGTYLGVAHESGTVTGLGLRAPVRILRDARGVPHIRAASLHDAAFAEGYVTGSDRLFQIDVTRRYVLGTLSEMFGPTTIDADENARVVDVRGIADREYAHLSPADRDELDAFAAGVNAAAQHEPAPPEYRALLSHFVPWRPQDSLAVGFAVVLDLTDSWYNVIARDAARQEVGPRADAAFFSLTDPAYPITTTGGTPVSVPPLPPLAGVRARPAVAWNGDNLHDVLGSNEWVAGAERTATGRALLANDPHLARRIPGIWYLVDIEAPGEHVAGAAVAGVPGVILGHNDRIAWGATYADAVSVRVFTENFDTTAGAGKVTVRHETFDDRFGTAKTRDYLSTPHGFVLEDSGSIRHVVQWDLLTDTRSPLAAYFALDRARSLEDGMRALANYPGPTQNFVLAQSDGRAAYTVAGFIPNDSAWGTRVLDGDRPGAAPLTAVPFARLPHISPARDVLANNSNNVPYAQGYPYRLSAYYSAPYRAVEIANRLRALPRVGIAESHTIQADTLSLAEHELARMCVAALHRAHADRDATVAPVYAALAAWDGHFDPASRGATIAQRVRFVATRDLIDMHLDPQVAAQSLNEGPAYVTLMRALREHPKGWFPHDDPGAFLVAEVRSTISLYGGSQQVMIPYSAAYPVVAQHPFASFGFHYWDAPPFPGSGGSYSPAVQGLVLGQSFRAVWDVGNWDAGGMDLPLGESGEPGSPHYTDAVGPWLRHEMTPLPFSDKAVAAATTETQTLTP